MPEETATAEPEATTETSTEESGTTFSQEQVNDLLAKQKGKITSKYADYGELKSAAAKLTEIEEASATELEKAQKKATDLETQLAETQANALRQEVVIEKALPAKLASFLTATDKESLIEQADTLLENLKPANPDFDGGTREPTPDPVSPEEAHNATFLEALGLTPN